MSRFNFRNMQDAQTSEPDEEDFEEIFDDGSDEEEFDEEFDAEVENRLAVANCFRALLETSLFSHSDKTTRFVERKIRRFVKEELEVLLGMRQETVAAAPIAESQFTDMEVAALKSVASKIISKPNSFAPPPTVNQIDTNLSNQAPSVNKANVGATQKVQKVEAKSAAPKQRGRSKKTSASKKVSKAKEEKEEGFIESPFVNEKGEAIKVSTKGQTLPKNYTPLSSLALGEQEHLYQISSQEALTGTSSIDSNGDSTFLNGMLGAVIAKTLQQ